jgi:ubiquinone/menaquinone biosynthesis C-methylase UbiE
MNLSTEYRRQFTWRDWATAFSVLPSLDGQTVLDLGCGVGDLAAELAARGARVIGFDMNEELLLEARSRQLGNVEFRTADLRALPDLEDPADGLWCSFAAAYFPDLSTVLAAWARNLKPGGWIALTEIDDLFGHEPLGERTTALLSGYADEAFAAGRYDFRMGRKLTDHLQHAGFAVSRTLTLVDQELSFDGPALPEVIDAWRARLRRMTLLREFCGPEIDRVEEELLGCLMRPEHRSTARVCCCIGTRTEAG